MEIKGRETSFWRVSVSGKMERDQIAGDLSFEREKAEASVWVKVAVNFRHSAPIRLGSAVLPRDHMVADGMVHYFLQDSGHKNGRGGGKGSWPSTKLPENCPRHWRSLRFFFFPPDNFIILIWISMQCSRQSPARIPPPDVLAQKLTLHARIYLPKDCSKDCYVLSIQKAFIKSREI